MIDAETRKVLISCDVNFDESGTVEMEFQTRTVDFDISETEEEQIILGLDDSPGSSTGATEVESQSEIVDTSGSSGDSEVDDGSTSGSPLKMLL